MGIITTALRNKKIQSDSQFEMKINVGHRGLKKICSIIFSAYSTNYDKIFMFIASLLSRVGHK